MSSPCRADGSGSVASRVIVGAASEREASNSLSRLKALLERD